MDGEVKTVLVAGLRPSNPLNNTNTSNRRSGSLNGSYLERKEITWVANMDLSFQIGSHTFPIDISFRKYSFFSGFHKIKKTISIMRDVSRFVLGGLHI
jgi:hypothetical protein